MPHQRRFPSSSIAGFTLVGLVITLTIMATVSGIAGFYYMQVLEDRKLSIAKNELDTLAKHIGGYLVSRGYPRLTTTTLAFLAEAGTVTGGDVDGEVVFIDPWGREYKIDPIAGVVYSEGMDEFSHDDDLRRPYTKTIDYISLKPRTYTDDTVPPVIVAVAPTGVIRVNDPIVRATFVDHYGGVIDPNSVKLWMDSELLTEAPATGIDVSAGQIIYTTSSYFADGEHRVVVQVADGAGNIARREWIFHIDTEPALLRITSPSQGSMIAGGFDINFIVQENKFKRWWIEWDELKFDGYLSGALQGEEVQIPGVLPEINDGHHPIDPSAPVLPFTTSSFVDGLNYISLRLEDAAGRIYSDQMEILLDNTIPRVYITKQPEMSYGLAPTIMSTIMPDYAGWADDSLQVATVEFDFNVEGSPTCTGTPMGPLTAPPVDFDGIPPSNWTALYNSSSEEWSTTGSELACSVGGWTNTTLEPQQTYWLNIRARDLAGNESVEVTTNFIIDLLSGGIVDQSFTDSSYDVLSGLQKYEPYRVISGLKPAPLSAMPYTDRAQTTGVVTFRTQQAQVGSWWEVVIDDYAPIPVAVPERAQPDGNFVPYTGSNGFDWTATGPNEGAEGQLRGIGYNYYPWGNNNTKTHAERRTGDANELKAGLYVARCAYYGFGVDRIVTTTFTVDTIAPEMTDPMDVVFRNAVGVNEQLVDGMIINGFSDGAPPYELHFGGEARDLLGSGGDKGKICYVWYAFDPPNDPPLFSDLAPGFPIPNWASDPPCSPCTFGIKLPAITWAENRTKLVTDLPWGLDGTHELWIVAEDWAGHTCRVNRSFTVNVIGPSVDYVTFTNLYPSETFTYGTTGGVSQFVERRVVANYSISDQVNFDKMKYRLTEVGDPPILKPAGTLVPVNPPNVNKTGTLVLIADSLGSELKSSPVSYEIEIWGESGPLAGPILKQKLEFKFLKGLAIIAPNYGAPNTATDETENFQIRMMGHKEQEYVANYLFDNVTSVKNKAIYNYTSNAQRHWGFPGPTPDMSEWLSVHISNDTTDVVVVLDQTLAAADLWQLAWFFYSDGDFDWPPTVDDTPDGDVIVWMGPYPFSSYVNDDRTRGWVGSTDGDLTAQRALMSEFMGHDGGGDYDDWKENLHVWTETAPNYQRLNPEPGDAPHMDVYLPSLIEHDIHAYVGGGPYTGIDHAMKTGGRWSEGSTVGSVRFERLFTMDSNATVAPDDLDGNNWVFRSDLSGGRFAMFLTYHDTDVISTKWLAHTSGTTYHPRTPIPMAGPVIAEFIENYLLNLGFPQASLKRVVYVADKTHSTAACVPVPQGSTDEEVFYHPGQHEGEWGCVTPADGKDDVWVQGINGDGSKIYFSTQQYDEGTDWPKKCLYLWEEGYVSIVWQVEAGGEGIDDKDAFDVAADGAFVVSTNGKAGDPVNSTWAKKVIYHYKEGNYTRLSAGRDENGHVEDAKHPAISNNGRYVTFRSKTMYHNYGGEDCYIPDFDHPVTASTDKEQIWRVDLAQPDASKFLSGWVTMSMETQFGAAAKCEASRITDDGKVVVFMHKEGTFAGGKMSLAFAKQGGGGDWFLGQICGNTDEEAPKGKAAFAITPDLRAGGRLPAIIFATKANFDWLIPDDNADDWGGLADNADKVEGVENSAKYALTTIYLFTHWLEPLIPLVRTASDKVINNVELSRDGKEATFMSESKAHKFFGGKIEGNEIWHQIPPDGTGSDKRKPWRMKIGWGVNKAGEDCTFSASGSMCALNNTHDYGDQQRSFISR